MKISQKLPMKSQKSQQGFTLVELIVVIVIISLLSTIGIIEFISYTRYQRVTNTALSVVSYLESAKSRASSQLKPTGSGGCSTTLQGFKVVFTDPGTYTMYPDCPGSSSPASIGNPQKLSSEFSLSENNISLTTDSGDKYIEFKTLTGGVDGVGDTPAQIIVSGYNGQFSKTITIYADGRIDFSTQTK